MQLPILTELQKTYTNLDLEHVVVIACQHLLETNAALFETLFASQLKPENTYIIGKCYSTHLDTAIALEHIGCTVATYSSKYNSHVSFDTFYDSYIHDFMVTIKNEIIAKNAEKILLIDDGGHLITWATSNLQDQHIAAIEQTSAGYYAIKTLELPFPVINVARSKAKLHFETPFIIEKILQKIYLRIPIDQIQHSTVLILGKGSLGLELERQISAKHIYFYDINNSDNELHTLIKKADIIIGATGATVLFKEHLDTLLSKSEHTTLISASSSDREFSSIYLRKMIPHSEICHQDLIIDNITLINSGFPINFTGEKKSVEAHKIQLTRGLMFGAIYQAMHTTNTSDIIPLDAEIQRHIIKIFHELN